ncbi:hypothetical protein CVT24_005041 [Panaeolus cyanescens]|uniref:tRNA-guanine(15) transglycosylase-like domain-containing protein n=1 Tax=Panaeolus cyanescens TaxID=181874 RepID=A0A409VPQ5_9AGAR|nr:hypothetical protein CVT24_005041 [Panaeolus cyanescens]
MTSLVAPTFTFTLSTRSNAARFGPRIGTISLKRPIPSSSSENDLQISTPSLITTTSRGVVPHLSRDHHSQTSAIKWVNVPFETFLEHNPPVPTLQPGNDPLHTFLGFGLGRHLVSMTARDPADGREMPPNGNKQISAMTLRGVRKLSPTEWRNYTQTCNPDIVFALSDTPFTDPPYSQKRLTKSIDRSASWLATMLAPSPRGTPNIILHMAGNTSIPARTAFSSSLLEPLFGPEAEAIAPFKTLDEGVTGYSFDLVPIRQGIDALERKNGIDAPVSIAPLFESSLNRLPTEKIRIVNSVQTPHEVLDLISTIGIDMFSAECAQNAANVGVAFDFAFPVRGGEVVGEKKQLGHNLYDTKYAFDFIPFADSFRGELPPDTNGVQQTVVDETLPVCPCMACSPFTPPSRLYHGVDTPDHSLAEEQFTHPDGSSLYQPPFTRAYLHHLLHTHEMSAHALLAMHNLEVFESFFKGIREVIAANEGREDGEKRWNVEVQRFKDTYDDNLRVVEEASVGWKEVDLARGKGRLAREKEEVVAE